MENTEGENKKNTSTDLTFFTNEEGSTLEARFEKVLKNVQFFDVLVGYFRTSGFNRLYNEFKAIGDAKGKIRILVGLNADSQIVKLANEAEDCKRDEKQIIKEFEKEVLEDISSAYDFSVDNGADIEESTVIKKSIDIEESVAMFKQLIKNEVLEIKAHPSRNIHAKVYISRFKKSDSNDGCVITGSSNFSESGLLAQYEFNVELKDGRDVTYALERFEKLWNEATKLDENIDLGQLYINTVEQKTCLRITTPYEMYLKFLYEYYKDSLEINREINKTRGPDGFKELEYQKIAVGQLERIVDAYGGAFLSDVVGLGKTYIAALYMKKIIGKKLVICPPHIKSSWEKARNDFQIACTIESLGKLDSIIEEGTDYDYVFIDEAHRFRNDNTAQYDNLCKILYSGENKKKVILITATPLNNSVNDFLPLLQLFLPDNCTNIDKDLISLEEFFRDITRNMKKMDKSTPEYKEEVKNASKEVRNKILSKLMIRRTRTELKKYYQKDLDEQGIKFPEVEQPKPILYVFDEKTEQVFNNTIENLKKLKFSRYKNNLLQSKSAGNKPVNYEQSLIGLMKTMLVKRLESSKCAFLKTVDRFIGSYNVFIDMYTNNRVYLNVKIDYRLWEADEKKFFEKLEEQDEGEFYTKKDFAPELGDDLKYDLDVLTKIKEDWKNISKDPKKEKFLEKLKTDPNLKDNQLIVFTESTDTAVDLYDTLIKEYVGRVLMFSSNTCKYKDDTGDSFSSETIKNLILDNFDPNRNKEKNDIRILVTTDVLAEGINLHKANIIVNYDLPWNPTRVQQRIGRVNRIGSKHDKIYIYNFFPASVLDDNIKFTDNIKSKAMAFAEALGQDASYLTEDEGSSSFELFDKSLPPQKCAEAFVEQLEKVNSKETYTDTDEDEFSELEYVSLLEEIRDNKDGKYGNLFEKIKNLPQMIGTARFDPKLNCDEKLITFFRKGKHKFIYLCDDNSDPEVLSIDEAIRYFKCENDNNSWHWNKNFDKKKYYSLLENNKKAFKNRCNEDKSREGAISVSRGGKEIIDKIGFILKEYRDDKVFFTEDEEKFLEDARRVCNGRIPKKILSTIKKKLEGINDSRKVYNILKRELPDKWFVDNTPKEGDPSEIILSEMLVKGNG